MWRRDGLVGGAAGVFHAPRWGTNVLSRTPGGTSDETVKLQARNCQHRLTIELGIIKAVDEVNTGGTRRRETDAKLPGPFGITAGIEGSGFFMADLNAGIRRALKASMMPLMPSPGSPKTVSTFHLISVSTRASPAVGVAIGVCLS
jgi:hypothetical protein